MRWPRRGARARRVEFEQENAPMAADVRIKRIYDQASPEDGARLLVDRVWPRGVTKEAAALTVWLKEIAPSTALRQWFGHEPARFAEFRRRYLDEIRANAPALERLRPYLEGGRVTLLYARTIRRTTTPVVLADYLRDQAGRQPCPSFGVRRATGPRAIVRVAIVRLRGANTAAARVRRCA
jgi:uncharacterized protein YeaO (DUF488 family)